jgi:hypothetical protein
LSSCDLPAYVYTIPWLKYLVTPIEGFFAFYPSQRTPSIKNLSS